MIGPTLDTPRLILRPPEPADFDAYADCMADEPTARYIGGVQSRPVAWRGFCTVTGAWTVNGFSMFSVIERESGRWLGRLGPWRPEGWPGPEVGWALVRDAQGRGYATEGAAAAIDWAFDALGWREVIHCIDPANTLSQRVATRLGSTLLRVQPLPDPYQDIEAGIWGQTREQWRARRGGAAGPLVSSAPPA